MATTLPEQSVAQPVTTRKTRSGSRVPAAFRSLRHRNFRYLWLGQFTAATAMHSDMVARGILVYDLTGSSTAVGGVLVARAVPMVTSGIFGGVAADRFDRKKLLLTIQIWSMAMNAIMALLILGGWIELWHVFVLAFGLGAGTALNQPVRTSIVPGMVPRSELANALSLNSIAMNSSRLIGPAIIAFVIHLTNTGAAYVWATVAYMVVLYFTTRLEMPETADKKSRPSPVGQLLEGFRYMAANRLVLALVILGLAPLSIGFAYQSLLPQFVDELGSDTSVMGYIISVGAIGGLIGGLTIASQTEIRSKGRWMLAACVLYSLALAGFAGAAKINVLALAFPLMICVAMSQTAFRSLNMTVLMETTPDHMRGRIVATTLLDTGLMPISALLAGILADRYGVSVGFIALSAGCLTVIGLVVLLYPKVRKL